MWSAPQNEKCHEPEADSLESKNRFFPLFAKVKRPHNLHCFHFFAFTVWRLFSVLERKSHQLHLDPVVWFFSAEFCPCRRSRNWMQRWIRVRLWAYTAQTWSSPTASQGTTLCMLLSSTKSKPALTIFGQSLNLTLFFGSGLWSWPAFKTQSCWANPCISTIIHLTANKSARHMFAVRWISCHLFSTCVLNLTCFFIKYVLNKKK